MSGENSMGRRRALNLAACRHPSGERGAILTASGIVAALVLTLSAAAVVQLSGGSLRGAFASSDTRQARGAAAEGIELMIATWNQPWNRALLVSGDDPADWTVGSPTPCSTSGATPLAIDLADGSWRDVMTGAEADETTDGRQFRLLSITYTASDGSPTADPRALRRTATPGDGSSGDPIPEPGGWRSLINLNDPDSDPTTSPPAPGDNTGYMVLEVEGREVRDGREVANSRLTQEFEVLPKCCYLSLGSGGAGSLGADSRAPYPPGCPAGQDWVARGPTSSRLW